MVKVKICGITSLEDALGAVRAGADALGFVCYKKSSRYITPLAAREIIKALPGRVLKVGVFVNARQCSIKKITKECGFDILQFHGRESADFCENFSGIPIIKAFRVKNKIDLKQILKYNTFACLFDSFLKSKAGGTGKKFNWELLSPLKGLKARVFLSGGLTPVNVRQAIKKARPQWVDVSSSVEKSPGRKDIKKVKEFIKQAKSPIVY